MTDLFEHGYAVVIGVNDNNIKQWALPTVANDVKAVHDVLVHPKRCAYKPENVKFLTGADSTKANILGVLSWLQEKIEADAKATAVIYYSGHGIVDKTNTYYLIPYDIQSRGQVQADALKADVLTAKISSINAQRMLVILDCCHASGMDVKDIDLSDIHRTPFPLDNFPETKGIPTYAGEPGSKSADSLLAQGEGRAILNSSTGSQSSYIRKDKTMSLFTYHLIEALTGHIPHTEEDQVVLVTDVMSWVTREVAKSARKEERDQTPIMRTSGVFPVAQLIGGEGVAKGLGGIAPDPLAPLPAISIQVDHAEGAVIAGNVATSGGDFAGRDLNKNTGDVVHGDKVTGDKVGRDSISIGNISGSSTNVQKTMGQPATPSQSTPPFITKSNVQQAVDKLKLYIQIAAGQNKKAADELSASINIILTVLAQEPKDMIHLKLLCLGQAQLAQNLAENTHGIEEAVGEFTTAVLQD